MSEQNTFSWVVAFFLVCTLSFGGIALVRRGCKHSNLSDFQICGHLVWLKGDVDFPQWLCLQDQRGVLLHTTTLVSRVLGKSKRCSLLPSPILQIPPHRSRWIIVYQQRGCRFHHAPLDARRLVLLGGALDINVASENELLFIPGMNKRIVRGIVEFRRTKKAKFLSVDDLLQVKGIGQKTLERLRPYVMVSR